MPTTIKAAKENNYSNVVVSRKVRSYADDPFFVKKAEEAKATIKKIGLPKSAKK